MGCAAPAWHGRRDGDKNLRTPWEDHAMPEIAYRAEILIEREAGSVWKAHLPAEPGPVLFGTHGAIAKHYGREPGTYQPHATTIDYLIAATGG
jgi:hypothetical protein